MTLDRYLKDVRTYLPADQADDIVNELSENLLAQFEDRENDLGRPLTEAEQEAILKDHGKPLVVAARYRADDQSFTFGRISIGPALFPAYRQVLSLLFSITSIVVVIGASLGVTEPQVGSVLSSLALAAVIQFGVITAIFVAAERAIIADPSRAALEGRTALPSGPRSLLDRIADGLIGKEVGHVVPRRTSATDLAVAAIFLGWLIVIRPPHEVAFLRSGPGWETYYLPLILVVTATVIQSIVTLVRPAWSRLRSYVRIASDLAIFGLFMASAQLGSWVVLADPSGAVPGQVKGVIEINRWIGVSLGVAAAIALVQTLLEVRRLWISSRRAGNVQTRAT
jgi:hypothetical protein